MKRPCRCKHRREASYRKVARTRYIISPCLWGNCGSQKSLNIICIPALVLRAISDTTTMHFPASKLLSVLSLFSLAVAQQRYQCSAGTTFACCKAIRSQTGYGSPPGLCDCQSPRKLPLYTRCRTLNCLGSLGGLNADGTSSCRDP